MAAPIPFYRDFDIEPERVYELTPLVRRITSANPSLFTFKGTNTYIVGRGEVAVIDPGPENAAHTRAILDALEGETVTHIVATHTHRDHSPGCAALKAATGAPTCGFGRHGIGARHNWPFDSPEGGDMGFDPDIRVPDGGRIEGRGWTLEGVFTPGHISNHLCFALPEEGSLFSGDHVMGWSTSIVSPPDGDMAHYMASLRKVRARAESPWWPGHGPAITDPGPFVDAFIAHREEREQAILACLEDGVAAIPDMVRRIYTDVDPKLHRAAGRSVLSHLLHMVEDGRAACGDDPPGPDSRYARA